MKFSLIIALLSVVFDARPKLDLQYMLSSFGVRNDRKNTNTDNENLHGAVD